jgi:hypothetical protein
MAIGCMRLIYLWNLWIVDNKVQESNGSGDGYTRPDLTTASQIAQAKTPYLTPVQPHKYSYLMYPYLTEILAVLVRMLKCLNTI